MRWNRAALILTVCLAAPACRRGITDADAEALVRRYDAAIADAYRAGDYRVAESVVGDAELRRLAGHIGARGDQGLTLDAKLLQLAVRTVEAQREAATVTTEETWEYVTRRIGSGDQVGPASRDRYVLRYHLRPVSGRWVVDRTEFAEKPEVGATMPPMAADAKTMHSSIPSGEVAATAGAGSPSGGPTAVQTTAPGGAAR